MTFNLKTVKILSLILIKYLYDVVLGKIFDTYFLRAPNHVEGNSYGFIKYYGYFIKYLFIL